MSSPERATVTEFVPRCPGCRKRVRKVSVEGEGGKPNDVGAVLGESFSCPNCGRWVEISRGTPWAPA